MGTTIYNFNSADQGTKIFLEALGLSSSIIRSGTVNNKTLLRYGIDAPIFGQLAGNDAFLSVKEVAQVMGYEVDSQTVYSSAGGIETIYYPKKGAKVDFINDRSLILKIFKLDNCPDGISASNALARFMDARVIYNQGVIPEDTCSMEELRDSGLSDVDQVNIQFSEDGADADYQEWGKSVHLIQGESDTDTYRGSSIMVYPGYILTAAHVVAHSNTGEFYENMEIEIDDRMLSFNSANVVCLDSTADLALIYLPELVDQDFPWRPLATELPEEEKTVSVGYPGTYDDGSGYAPPRLYTLGFPMGFMGFDSFNSMVGQDLVSYQRNLTRMMNSTTIGHTVILTESGVSPGDSGGPLLNEQGEVVGIEITVELILEFEGQLSLTEEFKNESPLEIRMALLNLCERNQIKIVA